MHSVTVASFSEVGDIYEVFSLARHSSYRGRRSWKSRFGGGSSMASVQVHMQAGSPLEGKLVVNRSIQGLFGP